MMGGMGESERGDEFVLPEPLLVLPSFLLAQLAREARRITARVHADGMRMPHVTVLASLEWFGPAAQKDISKRLGIDASDLVSVLDDLEERGLVERQRDDRDRRRYLVTITTKGAGVLHQHMVAMHQMNDILLGALDGDEREKLREMLIKMYRRRDPDRVPVELLMRLQALSQVENL